MAIPSEIIEFRKKAEKILNERVGKLSDFTDMDLQHLIEELQIYQIELELQNEELKLVRKEIEESCNKFFELYDSSPAAFVTVNRSNLDEIEAIYRSAPIGLCVFDRDLRYVRINDRLAEIHCIQAEEHIGKSVREIIPELADIIEKIAEKIFRSGEPQLDIELSGTTKFEPRVQRYFLEQWLPLKEPSGKTIGINVVLEEITERKNVEEALAAAHKQVQDIINNTTSMIYAFDLENRLLLANTACAELTASTPEQMIGKIRHEFMPVEDAEWHEANDRQVIEKGRAIEFEEHSQLKGRSIWLTTKSPLRNAQGKIYAVGGISTDVTEHKRAEEELIKSRARLRAALDASGGAVYDHRIPLDESTYHDDRWAKLLGYRHEELPSYKRFMEWLYDHVHPEDKNLLERAYSDLIEGKVPDYHVEIRMRHKHGHWIWVEGHSNAVEHDENGCVRHIVGVMTDITQCKRDKEALQILNETLAQQVAERTKLAEDRAKQLQVMVGKLTLAEQRERQRIAKVLHDHLQQLLVGAKINGEVLSAQIGQKHKELAENILNLINQSIQTSRSLTSELSPPVMQQGLSAVLQWTCRQMQENHGLTVDLKTDSLIDPRREDVTVLLYQSVRELLLNVVKHAGVKSACIEVCDVQGQLCLTVRDDGSGFDLNAIREMEGTGFGLLSIREGLELIGGNLLIESTPGRGASFSLLVPLETRAERYEEDIQKIMNKIQKAKTPGDKIRVLLVDDHTVVRQGLSTMLNLCSEIEIVYEAADGEEAVKKARGLQPDVILMDINMPKMDGVEATRIISSELPHMRIIGLSMYEKGDQANRMIEAGASAYCTKDGDSNLLLSAIFGGYEMGG